MLPVSHESDGEGTSFAVRVCGALACCWLLFLLWVSRYAMLDDALIHLRYASMLRAHHSISFDGVQANYGASSLLYVWLLATLRSLTRSPLLPKVVSVGAYLVLLAVLVRQVWRLRRSNAVAWGTALLLLLMSPYAVRWLTDGMETGLVALAACSLALLVYRRAAEPWLLLAGALLTLLRVDLATLCAFGVLLLALGRAWRRAGALALGSALGLLLIRLTMGHMLPDTALAKVGLPFFSVISSTAYVMAAAYSFGAGLLVLWLATAIGAWRAERWSAVAANLVLPFVVLAAAVRGQQMQGVRYVAWALLFSIVWNLCALGSRPKGLVSSSLLLVRPAVGWVLAALAVVAWAVELPSALHVFAGRGETFRVMRAAHLERLRDTTLFAGDVGFVGYFSQANLCDLNGLVNGRAAAMLSSDQRIRACLAARPAVAFLSAAQLGWIDFAYGMDSTHAWWKCGLVQFVNVRSQDPHFLLVRRSAFPAGCPVRL